MTKGWKNESRRHSLASKGIKTAVKNPKEKAMMKDSPIQLPTFDYKGEEYFVDLRLEEIRNKKTAKPIRFTHLDEDTKARIRGIRAMTSGMYYMESLDK